MRVEEQVISVWHEPSDKGDRPYRIDVTQYDWAGNPLPTEHGRFLSDAEVRRLSGAIERKRVHNPSKITVRPFQAALGWVMRRKFK